MINIVVAGDVVIGVELRFSADGRRVSSMTDQEKQEIGWACRRAYF
jgi:hypothetical protein